MATGLFFEDFDEGQAWTTRGRTVTEADVVQFAALSWDHNRIHTDEEYCKTESVFGTRIAHGILGLAISSGLMVTLGILEGTVIAVLGIDWTFVAPIKIGDTVHVRQTVRSTKPTSKPDRGVVVFETRLFNQRDEVVQQGTRTLMVKRKAA